MSAEATTIPTTPPPTRTSTRSGVRPTTRSWTRPVLLLLAGAATAIAADAIIAAAAIASGASADFGPLTPPAFTAFTLIGFAAAFAGWRILRERAARPDRVLRVLVPVLTVLSFIPDGILLATGFIPGSSPTAVAALALMHLVVVAVAIPVFQRVAPLVARQG